MKRVIGYGLTDVVQADNEITDERFNLESPVFKYDHKKLKLDLYRAFIKGRDRTEHSLLNSFEKDKSLKKRFDVEDSFHFGTTDFGLGTVFCVVPLWLQHEWVRHEDTIDMLIDGYVLGHSGDDWVKTLRSGIYPYSGTYMDKRTGERITKDIGSWARVMSNNRYGEWKLPPRVRRRGADGIELMDTLAWLGGFKTHAEAMEFCRPHVPEEVRDLCEFGEVFKDSRAVLDFVPMIYTYWS